MTLTIKDQRLRRRRLRAAGLAATAVAIAAAAAVFATGCAALEEFATSTLTKPTARVAGARLTDLTLEGATVMFDVDVTNPYSVPLPLANLEYELKSGGRGIARGASALDGTIPASGSRTIPLPARVTFSDLLGVLEGVRPGAIVPYDALVTLAVDAPGAGRLALPLERSGELPVPAVPDVSLERVAWDALTLDEARAVLHLGVTNTNQFRVSLPSLDAGVSLGGRRVGDTRLARPLELGAGDTGSVEIPISFSPAQFGIAAFQMLTGSSSGYELDGNMTLDTPFGRLDAPLHSVGTTSFVR